ncbi:hypothetical protein APSETT444_008945 [Aspergillus pseudonomiae]
MVKLSVIPNQQFNETYVVQADTCYQRALELYGEQIFNSESIGDGQYLHGRHKPGQAWTVHTLAVKAAFKLGLHSQNALRVFNAALAVIGVLWLCKSDYVLGLAMEQLATKARFYLDRAIAVLSQLVPGDPVTDRYRDIIQQLTELLNDPAGKTVTFI